MSSSGGTYPAGLGRSSLDLSAFNGSNDGTKINALLTSLAGPGVIQLPAGTAAIDTPIILGTGQMLKGAGRDATVLKLAPSTNSDTIDNADTTNGNPGCGLMDLTVDGNRANQAGTNNHFACHLVRCANFLISRVTFQNADGHGFCPDGQGVVTRGGSIDDVIFQGNSQIGYWGAFASRDISYGPLRAYSNGLHGFQFDHSEANVSSAIAYLNSARGIFIRNVFGSVYNNLWACLNGQDGIYVDAMTSSTGSNWYAANNSTSSNSTYHDINFSGDNTLTYGITNLATVMGIQAGPNANFGATTEGYSIFIGDPTSGNFGDLKLFGVGAIAGNTGTYRLPVSIGDVVIMDWPFGAATLRWWQGTGLATPNGFQLGTSAAHKVGLFGAAAVVQPSAAGTATGYAAGATAATFHSDDTYTGNTGTTGYTINGIVNALKNLGILHT